MQRVVKPKNARSKRALLAREPKLVEDAKTCVFVRGSQTSERVRVALTELQQLKRPHAVSFSKRNAVHPFDDPSPLLFWHTKNDASLFIHGSHSKKRPHNLTFVRLFNGQILDMLEVGIEGVQSMSDFPGNKASPGIAPLFHFVGDVWEQDPRYGQFRTMILDVFRGEQMKAIDLVQGLQYVISVSVGSVDDESVKTSLLNGTTTIPTANTTEAAPARKPFLIIPDESNSPLDSVPSSSLPLIHFRTFSLTLLRSGQKQPRVALNAHGPSFDFRLRRHQAPNDELMKLALKRSAPKTEAGKARKGTNKNVDIDEMGDKVGRVHVGKQDLQRLQSRKMKGLKRSFDDVEDDDEGENEDEEELSDIEMEPTGDADEPGLSTIVNGSVKR